MHQQEIETPAPERGAVQEYCRIINANRARIAAITAAAAVAALAFALLLPNSYTSRGMLLPMQEDKSMLPALMGQLGGMAGLAGSAIGGPTQADLYVTMLKSDAVKKALVERFKLMEVYRVKFRSDAYQALESRSSIAAGKKDGVITISVQDRDPKRAADLTNAYMEELGKLAVRVSVNGAGQNRAFLEERLATAKADLARAEESLKNFQAKNNAVDLPGQAKAAIEGVARLKAELTVQEAKLAAVRERFADGSAAVKGAEAVVQTLRGRLSRMESGGGGASAIPSIASVPALGEKYLRVMREYKMQETLVELLTKQYEMARLSESKDGAPFQVICKGEVPDKKSKPHRSLIVVSITFYAALLSAVGTVLLARFKRGAGAPARRA